MQSFILIRQRGWSGRIASLLLFGCLSSFLPSFLSFFLFSSARLQVAPRRMNRQRSALSRRVFRQGSPFGVILFYFHIFAYFSPKIVKIKPEIGNFRPKSWYMKHKIFQKLRNRTPWKFNTKLGTWNAVFGCNMMTS